MTTANPTRDEQRAQLADEQEAEATALDLKLKAAEAARKASTS